MISTPIGVGSHQCVIDHLVGDLEGHIVDGAAGDTGLLRGVAHFLRHHVGIAQIGEADGQAHGVAEGQNLLQVLICESLYKNTPLSD